MGSKPKVSSLGEGLYPGPGNYNLSSEAIFKNPTAFTIGSRYGNDKVEDAEPGPGTYTSSLGFKQNGPKIGTSKRTGVDKGGEAPGPGQYSYNRPFSAGPQYGFGNETKTNGALDQRPGPGQYDIPDTNGYNTKGVSIGEKFGKKNEGVSNPGPGTYDVTAKRPQSGAKIGRA